MNWAAVPRTGDKIEVIGYQRASGRMWDRDPDGEIREFARTPLTVDTVVFCEDDDGPFLRITLV